jgi:signal transduction histidine kinase
MPPRDLPAGTLVPDDLPMLRYAFGRAAHDLNNYLSGLLGYLGLIQNRLPNEPDCARFYEFMERSGKRMATLLKLVADLADPPAPEAAPVDANAAVREATHRIVESACGALEPQLELDEAAPRVAAHAGALGDAVAHLLLNAVEATAERPARVTVRSAVTPAPADVLVPPTPRVGRFVRIDVEDHGNGMDAQSARCCIVPFYTTKRATDQHGLGLAVACSCVCAWGGGLDLRSQPGAGTTVSLLLVPAGA